MEAKLLTIKPGPVAKTDVAGSQIAPVKEEIKTTEASETSKSADGKTVIDSISKSSTSLKVEGTKSDSTSLKSDGTKSDTNAAAGH